MTRKEQAREQEIDARINHALAAKKSFEQEQAKRDSAHKLSTERYAEFVNALDEHLSDAQREGDHTMAALYAEVLNGLMNAGEKNIDARGKIQITVDLARRDW